MIADEKKRARVRFAEILHRAGYNEDKLLNAIDYPKVQLLEVIEEPNFELETDNGSGKGEVAEVFARWEPSNDTTYHANKTTVLPAVAIRQTLESLTWKIGWHNGRVEQMLSDNLEDGRGRVRVNGNPAGVYVQYRINDGKPQYIREGGGADIFWAGPDHETNPNQWVLQLFPSIIVATSSANTPTPDLAFSQVVPEYYEQNRKTVPAPHGWDVPEFVKVGSPYIGQ